MTTVNLSALKLHTSSLLLLHDSLTSLFNILQERDAEIFSNPKVGVRKKLSQRITKVRNVILQTISSSNFLILDNAFQLHDVKNQESTLSEQTLREHDSISIFV